MLKTRLAGIITFPAAAFITRKNKPVRQILTAPPLVRQPGRISKGGVCLDIYDIQDVKYN